MLISVSAKNKVQLIDVTLTEPIPYSPLYPHWQRCNNMIKAWIMNSLPKDIAKIIFYYKTAREAWNNIVERYGVANISQYYSVQLSIFSTSQGSSDIATYYTKLKGFSDELSTISLCRPCTCGTMHELTEAQKLIQFLSVLNEIYSIVKSNILTMSHVPNVEKAYSILIRDEKQKEVYSGSQPFSLDSTSFKENSHSNPGQTTNNMRNFTERVNFEPRKSNLSCKYCKKSCILWINVTSSIVFHQILISPKEKELQPVFKLILQTSLHPSMIPFNMKMYHMGFLKSSMLILCHCFS